MFHQQAAPLAGSLLLSALVALLPLLTIFVMLGVFKVQAYVAGLSALAVALIVAVTAFKMPIGLALLSGTQGATFGLFPVMWIVVNAIWLYQLTVVSGRSDDLRGAFRLVSDDPRVQAIIIAFCFGGLLEALAGFGAPVAITAVMLMAVGFSAMRAATVVLLANTAPVAFGAIGIPVVALAGVMGYDDAGLMKLSTMVGRQLPFVSVFIPFYVIMIMVGWKKTLEVMPAIIVCGDAPMRRMLMSSHACCIPWNGNADDGVANA